MSEKDYDICIIGGLGRVGLPLGISFANAGKRVVLYDINKEVAETVRGGEMPFIEEGADDILKRVIGQTLFVSLDKEAISSSRFVIVVIGTPVDEHLNPKFHEFKAFIYGILDSLDDTQHLILRSTIYPGTTEKTGEWLKAEGKKTKLSFCPERIAEGKAMEELTGLPQIVASLDEASATEAGELFMTLTSDILPLTPLEAELAKLCLNSWRYIQFSIANQFYQLATDHNVDFYKIYDAITYKYPRAKSFPRAGFTAGPCLFKDTMQIAAFSNNSFFLGHAAMLVNEGLPNFIVKRLKDKDKLSKKTVGILGMAFKGDIDDARESLSYKLKKILDIEAREVLCSDPHLTDATLTTLEEVIKRSDILIIGAPHSAYRGLEDALKEKEVVDIWNFFGKGGLF